MATDIGSIKNLIATRGEIRDPGPVVVEPQEDGGVDTVHHVSSLTYIDSAGHWHAVLLDTVSTGPIPGSASPPTIEILSDVIIN